MLETPYSFCISRDDCNIQQMFENLFCCGNTRLTTDKTQGTAASVFTEEEDVEEPLMLGASARPNYSYNIMDHNIMEHDAAEVKFEHMLRLCGVSNANKMSQSFEDEEDDWAENVVKVSEKSVNALNGGSSPRQKRVGKLKPFDALSVVSEEPSMVRGFIGFHIRTIFSMIMVEMFLL